MIRIFCFLLIINLNCTISDPNYINKPLQNLTYTGFISRDFFQVVVEIPIDSKELPILKEREKCNQKAISERDRLTVPILRSIAASSFKNKTKEPSSFKNYKTISKNYQISRGEFSWFLDTMFLFYEDYSSRDKCTFIYRNIQDQLYAKVEDSTLVVPEEIKKCSKCEKELPLTMFYKSIITIKDNI